jgi:hypothetical protein
MKPIKTSNSMMIIPLTMRVTLDKDEADLIWNLIHKARGQHLDMFGGNSNEFTEKLLKLMEKFSFPDSSITNIK